MKFTLFALASIASLTSAAPSADQVASLPNAPALLSNHYSGYLAASATKNLHYYFVESEGSPSTDPVMIWMNGGPGCSSLDGFLYEHGPFRVAVRDVIDSYGDTTQEAYLTAFENTWSKNANTLYIEAPVGVGFSYSTAADPASDYQCTDDTAAEDNLAAVKNFFTKFPEYVANDLLITGESYAGIYVPTLAEAILQDGDYAGAPLKGIAVGNGCSGTEVGICSWGDQGSALSAKYLTSSGFLPEALKDSINDSCDYNSWMAGDGVSDECFADIEKLNTFTKDLDTYCVYCDCPATATREHSKIHGVNHMMLGKMDVKKRAPNVATHACINTFEASMYLNMPEVQKALHVEEAGNSNWEVCGSAKGWDYTSTRPNLPRDTYPLLVENINVLIYNGDFDACVPYTDGEFWTSSMNYTEEASWHAWSIEDGNIGGYATKYAVDGGKFQFITVKGGRHEVPETEPVRASEMIAKFIAGDDF
jgi:carboxypeptidase C (cathepsin A)